MYHKYLLALFFIVSAFSLAGEDPLLDDSLLLEEEVPEEASTGEEVNIVDVMIEKAVEAFTLGEFEEALEILSRVLDEEPDNQTALEYKKTIQEIADIEVPEEGGSEGETSSEEQVSVKNDKKEKQKPGEPVKRDVLLTAFNPGMTDSGELFFRGNAELNLGLGSLRFEYLSYEMYNLTSVNRYILDFGGSVNGRFFVSETFRGTELSLTFGSRIFQGFDEDIFGEDSIVPYVGLSFEDYILGHLWDTYVTHNLGFGAGINFLAIDDEVLENLKNYEVSLNLFLRLKWLTIGAYYRISHLDSAEELSQVQRGAMIGIRL